MQRQAHLDRVEVHVEDPARCGPAARRTPAGTGALCSAAADLLRPALQVDPQRRRAAAPAGAGRRARAAGRAPAPRTSAAAARPAAGAAGRPGRRAAAGTPAPGSTRSWRADVATWRASTSDRRASRGVATPDPAATITVPVRPSAPGPRDREAPQSSSRLACHRARRQRGRQGCRPVSSARARRATPRPGRRRPAPRRRGGLGRLAARAAPPRRSGAGVPAVRPAPGPAAPPRRPAGCGRAAR